MKSITITAYPYATVCGHLDVPDNIDEDVAYEYVQNHWREIEFEEPELDFCGTDMDIEIEEE